MFDAGGIRIGYVLRSASMLVSAACNLLRTWCAACNLLCTEAASQEAAEAGGQGGMVSGSCWPYHCIRSFHMKAPACDAVLCHPYIAENVMELQ